MTHPLLQTYLDERPKLLRVAYQLLGSQSEAEDLVQECYIKIADRQPEALENPRAYLMRILVNGAIDSKRALDHRKLVYVGPWLPEPFIEPEKSLHDVHDDVSMAFMVLLERLNPIERSVFILRESCEMSYQEIASILQMSEVACRKTLQRAQDHINQNRKRFQVEPAVHKSMTEAFLAYWSQGNADALIQLLQEKAQLFSDGGGKVAAALKPLAGPATIVKFLLSLRRAAGPDLKVGSIFLPPDQACLLVNDQLETLISFEISEGKIANLFFVRNPDKLQRGRERLKQLGA